MKPKQPLSFRLFFGWVLLLILLPSAVAIAATPEQVKQKLAKELPGLVPDEIRKSPVDGIYEAIVGPSVFYVTADGNFIIQGRIFDVTNRQDLTEPAQAQAKLSALENVGDGNMVVFAPEKYKHTVSVFTDIDCSYCRKLHSEIEDYKKEGIRVRYLFYPRAGIKSPSYDKAVSVWCADDRNQAMTDAKAGQELPAKNCENPVKSHMLLGEQMGVSGTPALVLDDGELLPGYVPAKKMASYLEQKAAAAK